MTLNQCKRESGRASFYFEKSKKFTQKLHTGKILEKAVNRLNGRNCDTRKSNFSFQYFHHL